MKRVLSKESPSYQELKDFFPPLNVCTFYFLASLSFVYVYFHDLFYDINFYDKAAGGIYYILSFDALKPNQYRLLVPLMFKLFKSTFPFIPDKAAFFAITWTFAFFIMVMFYNILNVYFTNKKSNQWLAFVLFYPMFWHYIVINQIFEFTDFANLLLTLLGYYFIIKKNNKLLILTFLIGTFNHDSIGFLIVMYILFNIKRILKKDAILNTLIMVVLFIAVKKLMEYIFISNPGLSFRLNYNHNIMAFTKEPLHRVIRNIFLMFGGLHLFVLYFFVSGKWKKFNTEYLYITLTIVPYVIIIFLIHTTFEARNYIAAIPFILLQFLLYFTTHRNSFLKPAPEVTSE